MKTAALTKFDKWLESKSLRPATKKQYLQIVSNFLAFSEGGRGAALTPRRTEFESLDDLYQYGAAWLDLKRIESPAGQIKAKARSTQTIGVYCSALGTYGRSLDLPVDFRSAEKDRVHKPAQTGATKIANLDDYELKAIRRRAGTDTPRRAAIELAIAGLTQDEILEVDPITISFSRTDRIGFVEAGGRVKVIFDLVSLTWLAASASKETFPSQQPRALADEGDQDNDETGWTRGQLVRSLRSATGAIKPGPPQRMLREAGVRRAIARGISPKGISRYFGMASVPPRWWEYSRQKSRTSTVMLDPIIPEWEGGQGIKTEDLDREPIADMDDDRFEALMNRYPD